MLTEKIFELLKRHQIPFEHLHHAPTRTCEESAAARGTELNIGGKTLMFKDKKDFRLFTLPANRDVNSTKVRKILKSQKLRFATQEELRELASVEKGALPPLGADLIPFEHYVDIEILYNDKIAFNPGVLTQSVILELNDWLKLVEPKFCSFSK